MYACATSNIAVVNVERHHEVYLFTKYVACGS